MYVLRAGLVLIALSLWSVSSSAQTRQQRCLHGEGETRVQAQRREEALDGADVINRILDRGRRDTAYPTWAELAKSPRIASYRGIAGRLGDLVRKMEWGTDQPLPGWRIHYVATQASFHSTPRNRSTRVPAAHACAVGWGTIAADVRGG